MAALARRGERLEDLAASAGGQVVTRVHDVGQVAEVPGLFEDLVTELGGLDLFVYAAGIMPEVGAREYDTAKDLAMLQVNLGGCVAWCNEAARLFGTQRSGTICGISSIAGVRGRKGQAEYGGANDDEPEKKHRDQSNRIAKAKHGGRPCSHLSKQ